MEVNYQNPVVLITSIEDKNEGFGTGFTIDQNGGYSYILTCAHVVRNAEGEIGKVKVNGVTAEVVKISPLNGTDDLAVLRVNELFGFPLPRHSEAKEGKNFTSLGYQEDPAGTTQTFIAVELQGTLGKSIFRQRQNQSYGTQLWELNIDGNNSPEPGNSGAPILHDGHVIGVLSEQLDGQFFAIAIEALGRVLPGPIYVPFTNREDELNDILSSIAPAYYLLDAPAGYGKSTLLGELRKQFTERNWRSVYQVLDSSLELDKLAEIVADKLSISSLLSSPINDQSAGNRLGSALRENWEKSQDKAKEGFVLLIDLDKAFDNSELLVRLLKEFVPDIQESLMSIQPFDHDDNRFRVIIAGRYIFNRLSIQISDIIPSSLRYLTPFKYNVIQNSAYRYLKNYNFKQTQQIAGHLLYLTGGHPGCMAQVLQQYKESGMKPQNFLEKYREKIWDDIVRPVFACIDAEFPTTLGIGTFMRNNVLRYMDWNTMRKLADMLKIPEQWVDIEYNVYHLSDMLTGAALLNKNKETNLYHDDITHRLVCLGLRHDHKDEFLQLCQMAQTICEESLREPLNPNPHKWAIEYLFQFLQQHAFHISNAEQRRALRKILITEELTKVLRLLNDGRIEEEQRRNFLDSIENDWEFMFTVNYFLRDADYNDDPVKELKCRVKPAV